MNIDSSMIFSNYDLQVYPAAIIGNNFKGCKILSIVDAESATESGRINAAQMHSQVYPTLPKDLLVADDYDSYTYVKLKLADGTITYIGDPWIIPTSLTPAGTGTVVMRWEGVSAEVLQELKIITQKNGYPASFAEYSS